MKNKSIAIFSAISIISGVLIKSVYAQQIQLFRNPTIDGKSIDACIEAYPNGDGCINSATQEIANSFCEINGYALANIQQPYATIWQENSQTYSVKKLSYSPGHPVWIDTTGGRIFTLIRCQ